MLKMTTIVNNAGIATNTNGSQTMLVVESKCAILLRRLLRRNGVLHVLNNKGAVC